MEPCKQKRPSISRPDLIRFILFVFLLLVFTAITIYYFPFFLSLRDPSVRMNWINQIKSSGIRGLFIALGIQTAQVVLAVIPGEPVEIAMGYLYGTWGGLAVCLAGIFIGTLIILLIVKLLGAAFVKSIMKPDAMNKISFLHNTKSLENVVFILFLIPGTPKDMLTYFIPLTPMKSWQFLLIATFARIPSVVTSTLIGSSLGKSNWAFSIGVFAFTAVMGLVGIWIHNRFIEKHQKK